jgi:pilus assembly protein CpaD
MSKPISMLAIIIAPALMLAGCGKTINAGVESAHQPVVSHKNYAFDVSSDGYHLAMGERERLMGWLESLRLGYGDRVAVDDPSGANGGARAEISAIVENYGLFLADHAPVTAGQLAPGTVRVIVTRSTADVPGCPDFSVGGKPDYKSNTASNYGCAVNSNLAAMVARPDDLVRGQPGAETSDTAVLSKAIQTMRKAPNTGAAGLKTEGTTK